MVYCGIGEQGQALAQRIEHSLNLVPAILITDQKQAAELRRTVRSFCHEAAALRPYTLIQTLPKDQELHHLVIAVKELYSKAIALEKLLTLGPEPAGIKEARAPQQKPDRPLQELGTALNGHHTRSELAPVA
jgi:hypothetical protein